MTSSAPTGRWLSAPNLSADAAGSIHDDQQAKALGFEAALIGGSVTTAFMTPALTEQFGKAWYERGFLKQSFIAPLYEREEFEIVFEELEPTADDERFCSLVLVTRGGQQHTAGYAGLYRSADAARAPWERSGEPPVAELPAVDPLPGEELGTSYELLSRTVLPSDPMNQERRVAAGNESPWYTTTSPWGGAIIPTFMYTLIGHGPASTDSGSATRVGMNGTFQLLQTGPMLCGQPYTVRRRLVEKGWGNRSAFRTVEFAVESEGGQRVAAARQKVRWLAQPPSK